jgi:type IV fimbrial biogenesis protein FimT
MPCQRQSGAAIIGQVMTLAIISITISVASPSLHELYFDNLLTARVNTFVSHLHYARSEAINRNQRVIMCRSSDGLSCERNAGWHLGWIIFPDINRNRQRENDETILRREQSSHERLLITSGSRRRIVFQPQGSTPGSNGTYTFCAAGHPALARAVILSNTGRPRFSKSGPGNRPLPCA